AAYHRYLHSFPTRRSSDLGSVPFANAGLLLNILCVCAPLITDEPLGRNAVVSLLGVIAILPLGYLIASCLKPPGPFPRPLSPTRSEEHTSELQSRFDLVCR